MRRTFIGLALMLVALWASANTQAGILLVSVSSDTIFLVDGATIKPIVDGRRNADVYILDKSADHDGRYTESFDCDNHRARKVWGGEFTVSSAHDDILRDKTGPLTDVDKDDDAGTTGREVEEFVCQWPASAKDDKRLPNLPQDERAIMLTLALAAMHEELYK
jgi:hypothetical protein